MQKNPTLSARSTYIVLQFVGPTSAVLDRQSREHVFGHFCPHSVLETLRKLSENRLTFVESLWKQADLFVDCPPKAGWLSLKAFQKRVNRDKIAHFGGPSFQRRPFRWYRGKLKLSVRHVWQIWGTTYYRCAIIFMVTLATKITTR